MVQSRTPNVLSTPDRESVHGFLASTRPIGCSRLSSASAESIAQVAATQGSATVGYAQAVLGTDGYTIDCVADDPATREQLVTSVMAELPEGSAVTWWSHDDASDAALAKSLRMPPPHRRLLNMRRPLPLEPELSHRAAVEVRPFVIGVDEQAWLRVNNAAFGWHREQGDWNLAMLRERMSEPWFDPTGFLLHDRDDRLAAFCWTKVHDGGVGEIYVIAVDPAFFGLGLGRALTVAGLRHLSDTGSTVAMLYVEADNTSAVRLYESLGFHTMHTDVAFYRPASEQPVSERPAAERPAAERPHGADQ